MDYAHFRTKGLISEKLSQGKYIRADTELGHARYRAKRGK
jgi:hypothetical protein